MFNVLSLSLSLSLSLVAEADGRSGTKLPSTSKFTLTKLLTGVVRHTFLYLLVALPLRFLVVALVFGFFYFLRGSV